MRGRRVLENTGNEKRRLNPMRSQSRNRRKLIDERRNANERSGWRIIIAAGSNERDCARVVDAIRIRVNALVQLRGDAERERPEKSGRSEERNKSTRSRAAFH